MECKSASFKARSPEIDSECYVPARNEAPGEGLGFNTVAAIMALHRVRMLIASTLDDGINAKLILPHT